MNASQWTEDGKRVRAIGRGHFTDARGFLEGGEENIPERAQRSKGDTQSASKPSDVGQSRWDMTSHHVRGLPGAGGCPCGQPVSQQED